MKDYDKQIKKDVNDYIPYDDEEYFEQNQKEKVKKTYKPVKRFNKENPYY